MSHNFDFWQWYDQASQEAQLYQVPQYELDWLVQTVAGIDKLQIRLRNLQPAVNIPHLSLLWEKRITQRVPVQYLAQKVLWRGLELTVNPSVLIPRPETELIIDLVDSLLPIDSPLRSGIWLDMGTGSGAIAIGLAQIMSHAAIHGVDISPWALAIAEENIKQHQAPITLHHSDWFASISYLRGQVAGIVSNPPYIPTVEIATLAPEVQQNEPHLALDGGKNGLSCIMELLQTAPDFLLPNGLLIIEVMAGQPETVASLMPNSFTQIQIHTDYSGQERFISGVRA